MPSPLSDNRFETIKTLEQLEAAYGKPGETSLIKEVPQIIPHYRKFIEASPFCSLATTGPDGMDCSPRGDNPGFVRVHDERTLMMPDRHGNNRTIRSPTSSTTRASHSVSWFPVQTIASG